MKRIKIFEAFNSTKKKHKLTDQIIASEKDAQVFFGTITNPKKPSETLKNAVENYKKFIEKTKID